MCIFGKLAYLNVSTLQCQAEASLLILHKVKRDLWVALLLQVGNDGLAHQFSITHHMKNLRRLDVVKKIH